MTSYLLVDSLSGEVIVVKGAPEVHTHAMRGVGASPESGRFPFDKAATRRESCTLHRGAEAHAQCTYPTSAISR